MMSLPTISIQMRASGPLVSSLRHLSLCSRLDNKAETIKPPSRHLSLCSRLDNAAETIKPKKPATPWSRYFAANMMKAKEVLPNTKHGEIMKELSSKWKLMSENEKSPFVAAYEKEKETYKFKVSKIPEKDLVEAGKVSIREKAKKRAVKLKKKAQTELNSLRTELSKPSRPVNAYLLYVAERSSQLAAATSGLRASEATRIISTEWTQMSDQKKLPYARDAIARSEKYKKDMEAWTRKMEESGKMEVIMEAEKKLAMAKKNVKEMENWQ